MSLKLETFNDDYKTTVIEKSNFSVMVLNKQPSYNCLLMMQMKGA